MSETGTAVHPDAKWYIVHTYSNFEKKVAEEIKRQAKIQGLDEEVVDVIVPIAMEEKLRFAIREGGRTVGAGVVSKVLK